MKVEELQEEIKNAMKSGDTAARDILRQVHNEVKNIEINERRAIEESDVDAMIKRVIKQTSETLEASIKAANNDERTQLLTTQVEKLKSLLPKQLEGEELVALIEKTIGEVGATAKKDMGKVMGALNAATGGNFDKAQAAKEVQSRLN